MGLHPDRVTGTPLTVRHRFGSRLIGLLLERRGMLISPTKLYQVYRKERLSIRCRRGRKRARDITTLMPLTLMLNQRWSLDLSQTRRGLAQVLHPDGNRRLLSRESTFIERFNGSLSEEILDTLDDARRKITQWCYDYNAVRPQSSLDTLTPLEARRMLALHDGSAPGALALKPLAGYLSQADRLSL